MDRCTPATLIQPCKFLGALTESNNHLRGYVGGLELELTGSC